MAGSRSRRRGPLRPQVRLEVCSWTALADAQHSYDQAIDRLNV
jgi:hypothetical protein